MAASGSGNGTGTEKSGKEETATRRERRTSLAVQRLRIYLPMQGDTGLIPGRESAFFSINPNFQGLWAYCGPKWPSGSEVGVDSGQKQGMEGCSQ